MNDLVWVFIFFAIMLIVRSIMTMIFYPYLAKLGYGTSPKDAAFMVISSYIIAAHHWTLCELQCFKIK